MRSGLFPMLIAIGPNDASHREDDDNRHANNRAQKELQVEAIRNENPIEPAPEKSFFFFWCAPVGGNGRDRRHSRHFTSNSFAIPPVGIAFVANTALVSYPHQREAFRGGDESCSLHAQTVKTVSHLAEAPFALRALHHRADH